MEPWLLLVLDEQAVLYKPAHDTGDDAVQKFVQILSGRRIDSMKTGLVVLHCVHPVQDDHVEVNVKVQRTAKALNEGHHAGSGPGSTGQSRALNQIGLNGSRDHRKATAERIGTAGEE